jgi:hypothetical protein
MIMATPIICKIVKNLKVFLYTFCLIDRRNNMAITRVVVNVR